MPKATTTCATCGETITEQSAERLPCPSCGSTVRHHSLELKDSVRLSDSLSCKVRWGLTEIRLAVLLALFSLGASTGLGAGIAEESVLRGVAWGVGAILISIPMLAVILRVEPIRSRTMGLMAWISGA